MDCELRRLISFCLAARSGEIELEQQLEKIEFL